MKLAELQKLLRKNKKVTLKQETIHPNRVYQRTSNLMISKEHRKLRPYIKNRIKQY